MLISTVENNAEVERAKSREVEGATMGKGPGNLDLQQHFCLLTRRRMQRSDATLAKGHNLLSNPLQMVFKASLNLTDPFLSKISKFQRSRKLNGGFLHNATREARLYSHPIHH